MKRLTATLLFSFACAAQAPSDEVTSTGNVGVECDPSAEVPLTLSSDYLVDPLEGAVEAYNSSPSRGGVFAQLSRASVRQVPACTNPAPTIEDVVELVFEGERDPRGENIEFADGNVLGRDGFGSIFAFNEAYRLGGPAFLAAVEKVGGAGEVKGWVMTQEEPCHNCTQRSVYVVLFYPETHQVVTFDGSYFWDS